MPGSIFSWEAEDMLVEDVEESIKTNTVPSVAEHNDAGLVIAIALQQFEEVSRIGRAVGLWESISGQRCVRSMRCP